MKALPWVCLAGLAELAWGASPAETPPELTRAYEDVRKEKEAAPYRIETSPFLDLMLESTRRAAEKHDYPRAERYLAKAKRQIAMKMAFRSPPAAPGYELKWLRRGKVHFQGIAGDTVSITAVPVQNWEQYLYITGPDNRTVYRNRIRTDRVSSDAFAIRPGQDGLYTLHLKQSYVCRVSFRKARKVVFEPEREFTSLFQDQVHATPFWFKVPEGTRELKVVGTNQNGMNGSAAAIRFRPQAGGAETGFVLPELDGKILARRLSIDASKFRSDWSSDESDLANYRILADTAKARSPAAGMWTLSAYTTSRSADDLGVWLEGVPNYLAPAPEAWFQPEFPEARAEVSLDTGVSPGLRPAVGAVWGWHGDAGKARAAYADLGLSGDLIFISHRDLEPENDNADPEKADMRRFRLESHLLGRFRASLSAPGIQATVVPLINPSGWLAGLEKAGGEAAVREFGEFFEVTVRYLAPILRDAPRQYYFQFHNEANHFMLKPRFMEYMREMGRRKAAMGKDFPPNFRLGGPGSGNGVDEEDIVNWDWMETQLREGDAYLDAVILNQYHIQELIDTWRFRALIDSAHGLIAKHDRDGVLEPIVLGQVNMREGVYLQSGLQDGFYNALWWISSLVNIFQAGSRVSLVNYFMMMDEGARKKGLFDAKGRPKPVALATGALLRHVQPEVVSAKSDHDGLDALATRSADRRRWALVYVNKTLGRMSISQKWEGGKPAKARLITLSERHPEGLETDFPPPTDRIGITLEPRTAAILVLAL
jgi:hypothetical protein